MVAEAAEEAKIPVIIIIHTRKPLGRVVFLAAVEMVSWNFDKELVRLSFFVIANYLRF